MSRTPKSKGVQVAKELAPPAPEPESEGTRASKAATTAKEPAKEPKRRRRNTGEFEERIGHRLDWPADDGGAPQPAGETADDVVPI